MSPNNWDGDLRGVLDGIPDALLVLDLDGGVLVVNPAARELFGDGGDGGAPLVPDALAPFFGEGTGPVMEARTEHPDPMELTVGAGPDRRPVVVEVVGRVWRDASGAVAGTILLCRDVTGRVRAERALQRSEEQLRQAQKMEAVGRLAGGIAHDFNNLLTAILGYNDVLLDGLEPDSPLVPHAERIGRAARRAASLTQQLLAYGRKQMLRPEDLDLNATVEEMVSLLSRVVGEGVELVTRLEPELGPIRADRAQVEQVLVNLIVNARDAVGGTGVVTVTTASGAGEAESGADPDRFGPRGPIRVSVADTGCGMDEATLERIFEPFFTTKPVGKGTGLGLATVYGIVNQSGGEIRVRSRPGKGTEFDVLFPRGEMQASSPGSDGEGPADTRGPETLLLVEDEDAIRELALEVLTEEGYRVLDAVNGEEALEIASSRPETIHLMITDVMMPHMNGRELAGRMAKVHPETAVLYTSGYPGDRLVAEGIADPGAAFLPKPFTPSGLCARVRELLDGAAGRRAA